jgi:hypothetical protein
MYIYILQNIISITDIYRSTNSVGSSEKLPEKLRLEALRTLKLEMFQVCLLSWRKPTESATNKFILTS